jgi:apolipoprotein N-acyltransferase
MMSLAVSLPFGVFWSAKKPRKAALSVLAFLAAYIAPPISLIGIANPLTASGCLFPSWGFYGIASMAAIYVICAVRKRAAFAFLCLVALLPIAAFSETGISPIPSGFMAINTSFGRLASGSSTSWGGEARARMIFLELEKRNLKEREEKFIVFPETIAGRLNDAGFELWRNEFGRLFEDDAAVIFGGEIPAPDGKKYDNALVMLHRGNFSVLSQRIPVPYSMYRGPFSEIGANLHFFGDGILELPDTRKAAVVICYETVLTWPILLSMAHGPDMIIVAANLWWCRETSLPVSMQRTMYLWGKLFGVPVVFSKNS